MKRIEHRGVGVEFQHRHWEDHWVGWTRETLDETISYEGILPLALALFPRHSRLLEAGCGTGKYCYTLEGLGYRITGIDFARSGLDLLHHLAPAAPAILGRVDDLPFGDATFDGALSLGVVEHFEEGPARPIAELHRVIRPGGRLLLTVPYHNLLQRLQRGDDLPPPESETGVFYQYLYSRSEMARHLRRAGFAIARVTFLGKQLGLNVIRGSASWLAAGSTPRRADRSGAAQPSPRPLARLKTALKRASPQLMRKASLLRHRVVEAALPGPVCAHVIVFLCKRP